MTIEELKQMLTDGKITADQFKAMALAIDPNYKETEEEPEKPEEKGPDIEKLIQQAVDRATNRLGNDNKKLRAQLDALAKEKLTAEERADMERQQEREAFERERAEFMAEKRKLYAFQAVQTAGLDDGKGAAQEILELVMAEDEAGIDTRIKALCALLDKLTAAKMDKTFGAAGRNPGKGAVSGNEPNPFSAEHWNVTEQMRLAATDPEKASRLQAAAKK